MQPVIRFENVGKLYRLGTVGTGTLSHDLRRWWITSVMRKEDPYLKIGETNDRSTKGNSDYVYALKDINLEVQEGDVLGIIGKNGAGKSTLLKLLSRVTAPTTGKIYTKGRIASLLEVGTGFHPELTGRENIYMNGCILGMKRWEIDKKLDEIVDFSGCERYIDTPVKRYSSGMMVRLGFAVAAHLDPEILVVDEVLAVGDAEFQKKAIGKMKDVSRGEGRTVLFVSHNMSAVKNLCKNGVILNNGTIKFIASAEDCVDRYLQDSERINIITQTTIKSGHRRNRDNCFTEIEFLEAKILNDAANIGTDEPLEIVAIVKRNKMSIERCQYTVSIKDEDNRVVQGFLTKPLYIPPGVSIFKVHFRITNHGLTKRRYKVDLVAGSKDFSEGSRNYDRVEDVLSFDIKYYNKKDKKEYLIWNKSWGAILHNNELIDGQITY